MGGPDLTKGEKTLAHYVAVSEEYLAELPDGLGLPEAAALPIGAETALTGLDKAAPRSGDRSLVVRASGGVGVYAVQIAAALGVDVTAIGGRNSAPRLKELGATTVHSYRDISFEDLRGTYDLVFDLSEKLRFGQVTKKLCRTGTFVNVNPQKDLPGMAASLFSRRKAPFVHVPHSSATAQTRFLDLAVRGEITPIVEAVHDIGRSRTAFTDLIHHERLGKNVISY